MVRCSSGAHFIITFGLGVGSIHVIRNRLGISIGVVHVFALVINNFLGCLNMRMPIAWQIPRAHHPVHGDLGITEVVEFIKACLFLTS
jgi:hypothetical protein